MGVELLLQNLEHHAHLFVSDGQLEKDLRLFQAFLNDFTDNTLVAQIHDVIHEAEDVIDALVTRATAATKSRINYLQSPPVTLLTISKDVEAVASKVRDIYRSLAVQQINDDEVSFPKQQAPRDKVVVGFDHDDQKALDQRTIIGYLLEEETQHLDVISIIGMPVLGTTTLARKIFRDPKIQYEFPTRIWVHVSQVFNRRDVFLTILKHFNPRYMSADKSDQDLITQVQHHLRTGRFVLFVDDVWTAENWADIEVALPMNNKSGKVVITSRDENVARKENPTREPHRLRFLDSQESWELLQLEIFGKVGGECPSDLEVVGKCIARQCGGVPLAILVVAGILIEKKLSTVEWEKVSESLSTYLSHDKEKLTEKLIELSFNNLPYELRDCFLYLGVFPEDTEISAWRLTCLWIAEGFIQEKPSKSFEEVAEDNLKDLIIRKLVMVEKTKAGGQVKTFRVQDMVRNFCINESAFATQNFFQEMKKSKEGVFDPRVSEIHKYRRFCIHSDVVDFLREKPNGPRVRSFLCFSKDDFTLPLQDINPFCDAFDLIRVLDVKPIRFTRFPIKLTHLIHLRYIALTGDDLTVLPEAISKLRNLQNIRIDTTKRTLKIKVDIWKMKELRHFKSKSAIILNKEAKGEAGENLQTLSRLSAECCTEEVSDRASNLKNLGIRGKLTLLLESSSTCFLEKLKCLQKLKLVHDVFPDLAFENPIRCLPQPDRFPPNLRILTLSGTFLDWKHTSTLGMLGTLEVLKLKENAFTGTLWNVGSGGFPSLEFLHISCTNLEIWTTTDDHPFPRLKCLVLRNCEKLEIIPHVLVNSRLEMMDIERVTKSAVASARKIEQEKQRMEQSDQSGGGFKLIIAPVDER